MLADYACLPSACILLTTITIVLTATNRPASSIFHSIRTVSAKLNWISQLAFYLFILKNFLYILKSKTKVIT